MITTKELVPFKRKVSVLVEEVKGIVIKEEKDMVQATSTLSEINKYLDSVKEAKERLTKPANEILKNARNMFKPVIEPAEEAVEELRGKMTVYQTQRVKENQEAAAKIASRVGEGKGKFQVETAVRKIESLAVPQKEVATEEGLVQFREVKRFEVMDMGVLPLEYHMANDKAIGAAMKEGKEVPGVRYFTEQVPVNYR